MARLDNRTIDFENSPSRYCFSQLRDDFLPPPLFQSRALPRASKQTRAEFIATFLSKAHIRLILHDLEGLATPNFQYHFCEDPSYVGSPCHQADFLAGLVAYVDKITLWIELPVRTDSKRLIDWSFLSDMKMLKEIEIIFKDVKDTHERNGRNHSYHGRGIWSQSQINRSGGSLILTGTFIHLLEAIPKHVLVKFRDSAAELRIPQATDLLEGRSSESSHEFALWSPQHGCYYVNPRKKMGGCLSEDQHVYMKFMETCYERHYGPSRLVSPEIMQRLYRSYGMHQGTAKQHGIGMESA